MSRKAKPVEIKTQQEIGQMTHKEYIRYYRQTHPEKALQWRLNTYANTLRKNGYTVIEPNVSEY